MGESKRSYWPTLDDEEIQAVYLRAQEMGRYVGDGVLDAGITGFDWIKESGCDVQEVCELPYSKETSNPTRWVLAVPNESAVTRPEELRGRDRRHRAGRRHETLLPGQEHPREGRVQLGRDGGEGPPGQRHRRADGDGDVAAGEQPAHHRHRDRLHHAADRQHAGLAGPFQAGEDREYLHSAPGGDGGPRQGRSEDERAPRRIWTPSSRVLPAEKSPTVSGLADSEYVAIEVIVDDRVERSLVPALKRAGASGIITYPLNKVIH